MASSQAVLGLGRGKGSERRKRLERKVTLTPSRVHISLSLAVGVLLTVHIGPLAKPARQMEVNQEHGASAGEIML